MRSVLQHDPLELGQVLPVLRRRLRVALVVFFLFVLLAVGWSVEGALAPRAEDEAAGGALPEVVPLRDLRLIIIRKYISLFCIDASNFSIGTLC